MHGLLYGSMYGPDSPYSPYNLYGPYDPYDPYSPYGPYNFCGPYASCVCPHLSRIPYASYLYSYDPFFDYPQCREHPPVDTAIFESSVAGFRPLLAGASDVLDKLSDISLRHQIMAAAQAGKHHEVDRLIKPAGSHTAVTTKYTPTGFIVSIAPNTEEAPCCSLVMSMKWGI